MQSGAGDTWCSRSPLPFAGPNPVRFKGLPALVASSQPVAPLASSCRADDVQLGTNLLKCTWIAWYGAHRPPVKSRRRRPSVRALAEVQRRAQPRPPPDLAKLVQLAQPPQDVG